MFDALDNCSKVVGAKKKHDADKWEKKAFKVMIRHAGFWDEPSFEEWLPNFLDAYEVIHDEEGDRGHEGGLPGGEGGPGHRDEHG